MTTKLLIFLTFAFFASLTLNSCSSKDNSVVENKPIYVKPKDKFHQTCDSSNKLIFTRYDIGPDSHLLQDLDKTIWKNTITDLAKVEKFRNLFDSVKNGGYCCCMRTHYTVSFYKDNIELGLYYIDTTDIKDKIVLFGQSFQTSYIIKLKDLNSILLDK